MFGLGRIAAGDRRVKGVADLAAGGIASGVTSGLVAGTRVATNMGWRAVEKVQVGDKVLTFDAGMQEVTAIRHARLWAGGRCPPALWPLRVPEEALGNAQPMQLLPEQAVMIESDVGEELYGDPFTLVPAASLEGFNGIRRQEPEEGVEVVCLHFDKDQVVFSSAGGLFYCPSEQQVTVSELLLGATGDYSVLSGQDAEFLLGCVALDRQEEPVASEPQRKVA